MSRLLAMLGLVMCLAVCAACSGGATTTLEPGASATSAAEGAAPTATPRRGPLVVIDPGHGGPEIGAADNDIVEKQSNLDMALRVKALLAAAGVEVVLTRRDDVRANAIASTPAPGESDDAGAGVTFGATRADLQRRIDIANDAGADLFVSIHSNGSTDQSLRGIEVYYDPNRPFAQENERVARLALDRIVGALNAAGYNVASRGALPSDCIRIFNGRCFPMFVLGPPRTYTRDQLVARGLNPSALGLPQDGNVATTRATSMPGVLVELLFISNPGDAAILADPAARDAMARGLADAIVAALAF